MARPTLDGDSRVAESHPYRRTFFRLLGFLGRTAGLLAVSIVLAVVSQAGALAFPFLTGDVVEARSTRRPERAVAPRLAIVVVGAARAVSWSGGASSPASRRSGSSSTCANALYAKLVRLSFGFFDRHQTGQLMSRATVDLQTVRFFLGYGLIFFFQHVFTVVGVTVVLFIVSWKLALVALAFTPVLVFIAYRYSRSRTPCSATSSRRWRTSRPSPRRTSSASTSSSRSRRSRPSRTSSAEDGEPLPARPRREPAARVLRAAALVPAAARAGRGAALGGKMVASGELALNSFVAFNLSC